MAFPMPPSPALAGHLKAAARLRAHLLRHEAERALLHAAAGALDDALHRARDVAAGLLRRPRAGRVAGCITES